MLSKLFHILLATLLLISSSGLVLSQHFCRGELKSSAVFSEALPCHVQQSQKRKCPHHPPAQKSPEAKKGCCDTTVDFLQMDDEQMAPNSSLPSLQLAVLFSSLQVTLGLLPPAEEYRKSRHYLNYKPPLLVCDRPVSFQTFLC